MGWWGKTKTYIKKKSTFWKSPTAKKPQPITKSIPKDTGHVSSVTKSSPSGQAPVWHSSGRGGSSGGGSSGGGGSPGPSNNLMTTKQGVQPESEVYPSKTKNELTGIKTLQPAPTLKEQYKSSVTEKGYISGSRYFVCQKISGWLAESKYSPVRRTGYAKPSGKFASTTIQVGPYFVPYVGFGLMLGSGAESLGTKKGRERISSSSEYWEQQYNVPGYISKPALYGADISMIYFGGKGTIKNIERGLKLPKTQTKVLGFSQQVQQNKVVTDILFKTKTKYLFKTKYDYGMARGETHLTKLKNGKLQLGETITHGSFEPYAKTGLLPTGKIKEFNVLSKSYSKESLMEEFKLFSPTYDKNSLLVLSREARGGIQFSGGKVAVETPKKIHLDPMRSKFLGYGGSIKTPLKDVDKIAGKTALFEDGKFLKQGQGFYEGYNIKIKAPSYDKVTIFQGGGTKSSQEFFNKLYAPSEISKVSQASQSAVSLSRTTPKFDVRFPSAPVKKSDYPASTGQEFKPKLDTQQQFTPIVKEDIKSIQDTTPLIKTITRTKSRGGSRVIQTPINVQLPFQKEKTIQAPKGFYKQVQSPKQIGKLTYLTPSPIFTPTTPKLPKPFIFVPPFKLFGLKEKTPKRRIKVKRVVKYTPSYSAMVFKMFGEKTKPTFKKGYTGLEIRKIPKGFSFSNLFEQPKRKRRVIRVKRIKKKRKSKGGKSNG